MNLEDCMAKVSVAEVKNNRVLGIAG